MLDVKHNFGEHFTATVFGQYVSYLDTDAAIDTSIWVVGGDAGWMPTDQLTFSVGYEKTLKQRGYSDNRFNVSVTYAF